VAFTKVCGALNGTAWPEASIAWTLPEVHTVANGVDVGAWRTTRLTASTPRDSCGAIHILASLGWVRFDHGCPADSVYGVPSIK
jgi:hypothetical protein